MRLCRSNLAGKEGGPSAYYAKFKDDYAQIADDSPIGKATGDQRDEKPRNSSAPTGVECPLNYREQTNAGERLRLAQQRLTQREKTLNTR